MSQTRERGGSKPDGLEALKARRAAASLGLRPAPSSQPARPVAPRRRLLGPLLLATALLWAGCATYGAVDGWFGVQRLREELASTRAANDERVRALTRRLVGVASQQSLEQDGLAERLADIITRQVQIENRQSALGLIADRLSGGAAAPAGPRKGSALETEPPGPAGPSHLAEALKGLRLSEQFDRLGASLGAAARNQLLILSRFEAGARLRVETVRSVLADLGLKIAPDPRAPAAPTETYGLQPAAVPDAFDREMARFGTVFADSERWSALADTLPLEAPIPTQGNTTSNFGMRRDPFTGAGKMHAGMDFRSPVGTPTRAAGAGRVISAGERGGYGNMVEIDHGHDLTTRYAHLSVIQVTAGQTVQAGTVVGLIGSTGRSTGPHLHYETRIAGNAVDPAKFITAGARLRAGPAPAAEPAAPAGGPEGSDEAGMAEDASGDE